MLHRPLLNASGLEFVSSNNQYCLGNANRLLKAKLAGREDHIDCAAVHSGPIVAFWDDSQLEVAVETIMEDGDMDFPSSVKDENASVMAELTVVRETVYVCDGDILKVLGDSPLPPRLFEQPKFLHGSDCSWEEGKKVQVCIGFHLEKLINGGVGKCGRAIVYSSKVLGLAFQNFRFLREEGCFVGDEQRCGLCGAATVDRLDGDREVLHVVTIHVTWNFFILSTQSVIMQLLRSLLHQISKPWKPGLLVPASWETSYAILVHNRYRLTGASLRVLPAPPAPSAVLIHRVAKQARQKDCSDGLELRQVHYSDHALRIDTRLSQ
nr:unnamed protein product [Spirometra erinaceieuropaei]